MNISRRFFIGGAASFGAFGGCRFLAAPGFKAGETPRLRFGVVSDIHILHVGADEKMEEKDRKLQGFRWLDIYRPRKPEDLFVMPVPRM